MMIVHKERRDRHLQKLDREQHHEELEECKVSDKARERFRRPPYQITDVAGYMAKKYDIKGRWNNEQVGKPACFS